MKMTTLIGVNPDCNHPTESRQKVQTFYYYNLSPYNKMSAMCLQCARQLDEIAEIEAQMFNRRTLH